MVLQRRQQLLANQGSLQKSLPYRNQGVSGRFTYGFRNIYLAEFTFGYNGSERFHETKRYGFFPAVGAGWVEGWRGEVFVALEAEAAGRIRRCHPHDPSWQSWPLLEHAVIGNIVPDFPLINKSFNLSYSGQDL